MTAFGLQNHYDVEELSDAETIIRYFLHWTTFISLAIAACFAGGIFYRIKTLKH